MFNGGECIHGNKTNNTGKTRVSFDFRILPLENYNPDYKARTRTKILNLNLDNTIAIPQMNNSKNIKFYLDKYNLNDPWDIVDLFEKKPVHI